MAKTWSSTMAAQATYVSGMSAAPNIEKTKWSLKEEDLPVTPLPSPLGQSYSASAMRPSLVYKIIRLFGASSNCIFLVKILT